MGGDVGVVPGVGTGGVGLTGVGNAGVGGGVGGGGVGSAGVGGAGVGSTGTGAGQACVLQVSEPAPSQVAPPPLGAGLVHVCVFVPPPQLAEQALHADQPPSIGQAWGLQV